MEFCFVLSCFFPNRTGLLMTRPSNLPGAPANVSTESPKLIYNTASLEPDKCQTQVPPSPPCQEERRKVLVLFFFKKCFQFE